MKKKITLIIGLFLLAILLPLAGVVVYALLTPKKLGDVFCSPSAERSWGLRDWNNLMAPALPSPPVDAAFFDSLNIEATSESVTVTFGFFHGDPNQLPSNDKRIRGQQVNYTIHRLPTGGGFVDDHASLRIRCLASVVPQPPTEGTDELKTSSFYAEHPVQYYSLDGRLLTEEEEQRIFGKRRMERSGYVQANKHAVGFYFDLDGFDSPKVLGSWLFDRTTKIAVSTGGRWHNPEQNPYDYTHQLSIWRSAPVDFIVDVAHGPLEMRDMTPKVGERAVFDNFECRLIAVADGDSYMLSESDRKMSVNFRYNPPRENGAIFIFGISPECQNRSLEAEVLDHAGNPFSFVSKSGNGSVIFIESNQPREQISAIRLIHRPFTKRIVVPVDILPGLPPENSEVDNLFDVRIPYVWIDNEHQMSDLLRGALQVRISQNFSAIIPPGFFPREYRDATPREILLDYWLLFPGTSLRIDQQNSNIMIRRRRTFLQRIQDKLNF